MSKTFYVITEEYDEERCINEKNVLYAFETQEEALYVLHLLEEESANNYRNNYSYDLSIVNNNHPYEKLSQEEMLSQRRERDAHKRAKDEMAKQEEYVKLSQNRIMKIQNEKIQNDINKRKAEEKRQEKRQEREQECQGYKEKIYEFLDWLQNARNYIATYKPKSEVEEQEEEDVNEDKEEYEYNSQHSSDHYEEGDNKWVITPIEYEYEVKYKLSLIKNEIQEYLLDNQDERVMELVNKPVYELLNLPSPLTCYQTPSIYIPKRLRQVMEQDKKK